MIFQTQGFTGDPNTFLINLSDNNYTGNNYSSDHTDKRSECRNAEIVGKIQKDTTVMNKDDKKQRALNIQKEASILLASEMSEVKGGTMSSTCVVVPTEPTGKVTDTEIPSEWGCSSCNKSQSCQTHT